MKIKVIIPVYNEESIIKASVDRVLKYFKDNFKDDLLILIADNASTDKTQEISKKICSKNKNVKYLFIPKKGRGRALQKAYPKYNSDINLYFDVDLATDLSAIKKVKREILKGADIVAGNRYMKESTTNRTAFRLLLSKVYNILVRLFFKTKITDFQCGFKAITKNIASTKIKNIKDNEWFFDTELLIKSEKQGLKISQIPVNWKEQEDTKVKFVSIVINYIKKLIKLKIELL